MAEATHDLLFEEYVRLMGDGIDRVRIKGVPPLCKTDALLVVGMQADFVPQDPVLNPEGGRFGVTGGANIVGTVVDLIDAAVASGATVCATRAYHPRDFSAFTTQGGPFPPHCVQGTAGSRFLPPVAAALANGVRTAGRTKVYVAFKGLHEDKTRMPQGDGAKAAKELNSMGSSLILKQSALLGGVGHEEEVDVDAPPDVLAVASDGVERGRLSLQQALGASDGGGPRRLFVCGLPLDYAVVETCVQAAACGYETYLVYDAARAAHMPGIGKVGSGFLVDPVSSLIPRLEPVGVRAVTAGALLGKDASIVCGLDRSISAVLSDARDGAEQDFPDGLLPFTVRPTTEVRCRLLAGGRRYTIEFASCPQLRVLEKLGLGSEGSCTPVTPLPAQWPEAPLEASFLCFANPIQSLSEFEAFGSAFMSCSASPVHAFAAYGGFLLLDNDHQVVSVQAIAAAGPDRFAAGFAGLQFAPPRDWPAAYTRQLNDDGRLLDVTMTALARRGASAFGWINPREAFSAAGHPPWVATESGGFVYTRLTGSPIFFELLPQPKQSVAYVTDIEGNWEYFLSWIERSEGLTLNAILRDGSAELSLSDGWRLVFGGDVCDKGGAVGGTMRVATSLIRLKEKYGRRVTILVGNRDANKMRLTSEMHASQLTHSMLPKVPGPYFVNKDRRVTPLKFISKLAEASKPPTDTPASPSRQPSSAEPPITDEIRELNTPINRIRYILVETMGAAGEEERRRAELAHVTGRDQASVSDAEVVASFVESVEEGGFMRRYLQLAQLAAIIDGTLYVHGGVVSGSADNDCIGLVPGHDKTIGDLVEWVDTLNGWHARQVKEWIATPLWADPVDGPASVESKEAYGARGGQALMDYVCPGGPSGVVLSRHLDKKSMPLALSTRVLQKLVRGGVSKLVIGHTPHGNCPTFIKQPEAVDGVFFETVMADTSYSDMSAGDNRGQAVSNVDFCADGVVRVSGVLHDGKAIDYAVDHTSALNIVGKLEVMPDESDEGRRFVKARFTETGDLLMCRHEGFKVEYSTMSWAQAQRMFGLPKLNAVTSSIFTRAGDPDLVGCEEDFEAATVDVLLWLFRKIDVDRDESLSYDEIKAALEHDQALLKVLSTLSTEIRSTDEAMRLMDTATDGRVSLQEFLEAFGATYDADVQARWEALQKEPAALPLSLSSPLSARPPKMSATPTTPHDTDALSTEALGWREKALAAEARASSFESQVDSYWHSRYLEAESRARTAEDALRTTASVASARSPSARGSVGTPSERAREEAPTPQRVITPDVGGSQVTGRHSAHLIMGRCITELSKIADDMRTTASGSPAAKKTTATVVEQAAAAARLAQQVSMLKALQRRQDGTPAVPQVELG